MTTQLMQEVDEYKESELGLLPKDWRVVKLEEIADILDKKRVPLSEDVRAKRQGIYPYCGANGIIDSIDDYIFDGEFVLLAEDGGYWGAYENSAYIMNGKFWVNNHAHIIKAIEGKTTNKYLMYFLVYTNLSPLIGGDPRGKLTQNIMKSILVSLPPLPEQKNIAYILSTIEQARDKTDTVINSLKELKKSLMKHLFTYGAVSLEDAEKVKLKETEIGMIPEGWKVKELKEIATLQRGKDLPKQEWKKGTVPIVGSSGKMGYHEEAVCKGPGVITGRSGSIGKVTYVEEDYWPHNTALYVKDFHDNDTKFVYYLIQTLDFEKYATGVSVPTLNRNFIHMAKKAVPSLSEQQEIAFILSTIDSSINCEENRKRALDELFKSMLHNLMSAKIRVKDLVIENVKTGN